MRKKSYIGAVAAILTLMSISSFSPALAQKTSYPQAVASYKSGNYAKALSQFKSVAAVYPNNPLVRYYLALSHQALGHMDLARAEYEKVATLGDQRLIALAQKGLAQLSGVKSHLGPSSAPQQVAGGTAQPAGVHKKIARKVLYFWADW
ncbi:MAG: tetratricopeptide repeat protein [Candidatus Obscuribacterales bacterium]|nr:tetratricopeptide repeat protein [Candidatus Obscuribacterales bacterium]